MKPKLVHLPLERYRERYTQHLHDWEVEAFSEVYDVETIDPTGPVVLSIQTGEVLDSTTRSIHALAQTSEAILKPPGTRIWMSDFFHPGYEAFPYSRKEFRISSFCWAQSFDQFDFTRKMQNWMRAYEIMAFNTMENVYVACSELADLIVTALPGTSNVHVVNGLPFNSVSVLEQLDPTFDAGAVFDAVYSSRWDHEKNPFLFLSLVEHYKGNKRFAVCTGSPEIKGNDQRAIRKALELESKGWLHIFRGCTKGQYYQVLRNSLVQINTASQDWVSFTLLEALTFDCMPLYPNYRGFPAVLEHEFDYLYRPADPTSLKDKFESLLKSPSEGHHALAESILNKSDSVLPTIAKELV